MKVSTIIFILAFVPVASALKGSEVRLLMDRLCSLTQQDEGCE